MKPRRRQGGVALILVLWVIALLTVIAGSFSYSMRTEAMLARNQVSLGQARALADGGIYRAMFESSRPQVSVDNEAAKPWQRNGRVYQWQQGEATISVRMMDESGKIDLNTASDALLKTFLQGVGGLDEQQAQSLLEVILDWKDPDDLRRPNGAEAADYRAAGRNYGPANAPFDSVGDLQRVLGMTPALYAKLAPYLTVYSRQPGLSPLVADRAVLLSLPGATAEMVDEYIAKRQEALNASQPVPGFPPANAFGAGNSGVTRVRAEAVMPDGIRFAREAVYRAGDPRRTQFLYWAEASYENGPMVAATSNGSEANR
jgi:general secretion pathway protein K